METPESIKKDEPNYKPQAWHGYTLAQLAVWLDRQRRASVVPLSDGYRARVYVSEGV